MIRYLRRRFGSSEPGVADELALKILMVCMGNICRSPLAEGVLRHRLSGLELPVPVVVDSAGTHGYHTGAPPDRRAQEAALRRGIDISGLRARLVQAEDFLAFDLILAMDQDNLAHLLERAPDEHRHKVSLYLEYTGTAPGQGVPDPYYGGMTGFERVLDLVEEATSGLLLRLEALAAERAATAAAAAGAAAGQDSPD
jgi:protein-tyrosine phosphatase